MPFHNLSFLLFEVFCGGFACLLRIAIPLKRRLPFQLRFSDRWPQSNFEPLSHDAESVAESVPACRPVLEAVKQPQTRTFLECKDIFLAHFPFHLNLGKLFV